MSGGVTPTTNGAISENLNLRHAATLRCRALLQTLVVLQVVRKSQTSSES